MIQLVLAAAILSAAFGAEDNLKDARLALAVGNYAKATDLAKRATEKYPKSFDGFILLAQSQRLLANFRDDRGQGRLTAQSVQSLKQAISLLASEKSEEAQTDLRYCQHILAAWAAAGDQAWAKAGAEYSSAAKLKPEDEFSAFGLMLASRMQKDIGPWVETVRRLSASTDPNFSSEAKNDRILIKGQISAIEREATANAAGFLQSERFDDAEALLRGAVLQAPPSGALHFELATVLSKLGKVDEAMREFREAIRYDFTEVDRYVGAAELPSLLNNKEYLSLVSDTFGKQPANRIISFWKDMGPTIVQKHHQRFLDLARQARDLAANQQFENALKLARQLLALHPAEGDAPQLIKEIELAKKRATFSVLLAKAREMATARNFSEAEKFGKEAIALLPESSEAADFIADLSILKQRHASELLAKARFAYKKQRPQSYALVKEVLSLFPDNKEALLLQSEIDNYYARLDALRKKVTSAQFERADLDMLEAIVELR